MSQNTPAGWKKAARGRLRFELAGLSFAQKHGLEPEDWARHLWNEGAAEWMGTERPNTDEYFRKEAEAFRDFYPEVSFSVLESGPDQSRLIFTEGCLGGWGNDRWAMAQRLGLTPKSVCAYCRESFRVWGRQLGLRSRIGKGRDGVCRLIVTKQPRPA